ncbi:hypothetical protein SpCBS45565_g04556 [Spizellomyces sp. 'palustris']|nr:hypothetical protein SpCBS45565_g04556 [Spizellomyces sp. 'palustris']
MSNEAIAREADALPSSIDLEQRVLNEENLRQHTQYLASQHTPKQFHDRIRLWASDVSLSSPESPDHQPQDQQLPYPQEDAITDLPALLRNLELSPYPLAKAIQNLPPNQKQALTKSHPDLVEADRMGPDRTAAANVQKGNQRNSLFRSMPTLAGEDLVDGAVHRQQHRQHQLTGKAVPRSQHPHSGSKVICCLKIEIAKGKYEMLTVHDTDTPTQLAQSFCREHNLPNWVQSLENHIRLAKQTYG